MYRGCCVDPQVVVTCLRVVFVLPYRLRFSLWCDYVFITTYLSRCRRVSCKTHVLYCVQYTQCIETTLSGDKITSIATWWILLDFFTEYTCRNKWLHVQFVKSAALSKTMIKEHCLYRYIGCKCTKFGFKLKSRWSRLKSAGVAPETESIWGRIHRESTQAREMSPQVKKLGGINGFTKGTDILTVVVKGVKLTLALEFAK